MALLVTTTLDSNLSGPIDLRCYAKVVRVNATKAIGAATVQLFSQDRERLLATREMVFPMDCSEGSQNFIGQAYSHLRKLAEEGEGYMSPEDA